MSQTENVLFYNNSAINKTAAERQRSCTPFLCGLDFLPQLNKTNGGEHKKRSGSRNGNVYLELGRSGFLYWPGVARWSVVDVGGAGSA